MKHMKWKKATNLVETHEVKKGKTSNIWGNICFHSRSEYIWKDLTDEFHQLRSKLFTNFFTDVSSSSVHWCLSLAFPTMFVVYKLQLAQTSNKLTTRWKLKSRSNSKPPRKTNWNRDRDRSPKLKSKWKSKLTENWNRDRNRDRLLKSRSKSRSTPENETKMEIDFGAKKTFGSRLRVQFLGPLDILL